MYVHCTVAMGCLELRARSSCILAEQRWPIISVSRRREECFLDWLDPHCVTIYAHSKASAGVAETDVFRRIEPEVRATCSTPAVPVHHTGLYRVRLCSKRVGIGWAAWSRDALPRAARRVAPPATLDIFSHHRLTLRPGDSLSIWVLLRMCNCPISTGLAEHADAIDLAAVREHGHHGGHPTGACAGVGRGDLKGFAGTRCVEALLSETNAAQRSSVAAMS
jgi:hypothetical protein